MKHINIEIKAKCLSHEKIRTILMEHDADRKGTDHQIDTYFKVSKGRLKLREGTIENSLIYYERENKKGPKQSDITLFESPNGPSLKIILCRFLEPLVVVDKQREIYFIENVKFHLDTVADLGMFIEIEAIATDGNIATHVLLNQCNEYLKLFGIAEENLLASSYSDLLLERAKR